ncbi:hypothetical protein HanPSC8_Chr17g0795191 [Helianthus annuus]|nr:hypothetical protein HanPSC8_Chr17g0795191 [Helianthus annuus]
MGGRSPSPKGRYGGCSHGRDLPTSLLFAEGDSAPRAPLASREVVDQDGSRCQMCHLHEPENFDSP